MDRHKTSSAESGLAFPPETINLTQFTWHKIYFLPVFRTNEKHQAWKGKRKKKKEQDTQRENLRGQRCFFHLALLWGQCYF